jgi:hypothetical protein
MHTPRGYQTATLLPSGKLLVAGGYNGGYLASTELYDPLADTWENVASLHTARYAFAAALLPNGKVLVTGGNNGSALNSAELYDPAADTWTNVAAMTTARYGHTETLLPNGKVLVAGGGISDVIASAELYDPGTDTWTSITSLNTARYLHTATLLPNGKVLVAGGSNGYTGLANAEVYDPGAGPLGTWTSVASLNTARRYHTATLLPGGKVLVAGGSSSGFEALSSSEIYDPIADTWTIASISLNNGRFLHTATLLADGNVLVAAGSSAGAYGNLAGAELFDPGLGFDEDWRPSISSLSSPLISGRQLLLTGTGFRGYGSSEASGGGTSSSASNYPLVQIRRLDNEQCLWVSPAAFSATSYTSNPITNMQKGPVFVTVFVNGIPSVSKIIVLRDYFHLYLPFIRR